MKNSNTSKQSGFTLIEATVSILILTVGLLAMASAISYAVMARSRSRNSTEAKLLIVSTLEHLESLRNTKHLTFGQIANVDEGNPDGSVVDFGGFSAAFLTVSNDPGPDGIYGTTDDLATALRPGIERKILIAPLPADADIEDVSLKKITVTIRYPTSNGGTQELSGVGYLNNDSRSNFIN
ncbi:MAG: prepilin-type N-terminal cleavage/methylation domain-containing protein [Acidobacteriota bacterium]|nr:prepilin-type N-terminal cleavage/methylation domain-containing protein [Acidobacteriota bacterium]